MCKVSEEITLTRLRKQKITVLNDKNVVVEEGKNEEAGWKIWIDSRE